MITAHLRFILLATGAMTCVAVKGFLLLPRHLLRRVFGVEETGPALMLVTMLPGLPGSPGGAGCVCGFRQEPRQASVENEGH